LVWPQCAEVRLDQGARLLHAKAGHCAVRLSVGDVEAEDVRRGSPGSRALAGR
jgi:hypothetical protein